MIALFGWSLVLAGLAASTTVLGNLNALIHIFMLELKEKPNQWFTTAVRGLGRLVAMYFTRVGLMFIPVVITMYITLPAIVGPLWGLGGLLAPFVVLNTSFTIVPWLEEEFKFSQKVKKAFDWFAFSTIGHILMFVSAGAALALTMFLGFFYLYLRGILWFPKPEWAYRARLAREKLDLEAGITEPAPVVPEQVVAPVERVEEIRSEAAVDGEAAPVERVPESRTFTDMWISFRSGGKKKFQYYKELRKELKKRGFFGKIDYLAEKIAPRIPFEVMLAVTGLMIGSMRQPIRSLIGSEMFNAERYVKLVGSVHSNSSFTADFPETTPDQLYEVGEPQLPNLSQRALGEDAAALGSRFHPGRYWIQRLNGKTIYVAPLEFNDVRHFWTSRETPGFVVANVTSLREKPTLIGTVNGEQIRLRYLPTSWSVWNLKRHLWLHGYYGWILSTFAFQLDDSGRPWWVVSLQEPTIQYRGRVIRGVLLVDPQTGEIRRLNPGSELPPWVETVLDVDMVTERAKVAPHQEQL